MSADEKVWIYGVVPAGVTLDAIEARGDRLPEVWVAEADDLGAIVGRPPTDDAKGTRDQALAHAHVLEAAAADSAVVPLRFGTVAASDEEVGTALLQARHDELAGLLERIDGRLQMGLKAYYREEALLREIVEGEPEIAELREQAREGPEAAVHAARVRMGELVSNAVDRRRQQDAAAILQRLDPVTVAAAAGDLEQELMVVNAPLLVERQRRQALEDAVEELAREAGERMRFRLLGPMPVYDFLDQAP